MQKVMSLEVHAAGHCL